MSNGDTIVGARRRRDDFKHMRDTSNPHRFYAEERVFLR